MHRRPGNHYRIVCRHIYILIGHQLDLSSPVTDLYIDGAGEIRATAEYLKWMREDIRAIWRSHVKEDFYRLKHNIPFAKKFIASHTPADDDFIHYDTVQLTPFEGEQ